MKYSKDKNNKENNIAFIDGQNLHLGTTKSKNSWIVDLFRFRIYLKKKYGVKKCYYFLGCINGDLQGLYDKIQESGFILKFRKHNNNMLGNKKGNVDTDIVFDIMKRLYYKENFDKIILVSGDGDYIKMVDFLIKENRFEKILFPNKEFTSSLYKKISRIYYDYLENSKEKIEKKEKGALGS